MTNIGDNYIVILIDHFHAWMISTTSQVGNWQNITLDFTLQVLVTISVLPQGYKGRNLKTFNIGLCLASISHSMFYFGDMTGMDDD